MMTQRFVIDGYNLMYRMPDLAQMLERDHERARELLVRRLADFRTGGRTSILVVFDGSGGDFILQPGSGVRALFARHGRTADDEIRALVARDRNPRSWTVVTSDRAIVRDVRDYGAKTISADEFAAMLAPKPRSPARAGDQPKPEMGPGDVADWEAWFRSIKPDFGASGPVARPKGRRKPKR